MTIHQIHISDVRNYLKCRRQWRWTSPLWGNMEPAIPVTYFYFGRAVHHCLEMKASQDKPFDLSFQEFIKHEDELMAQLDPEMQPRQDQLVEAAELAWSVLKHYEMHTAWDNGPWSDANLEYLQTETPFQVQLRGRSGRRTDIFLSGRYDGIVQRKDDKSFWIFETKTTRAIGELERSLDNDLQAGMYIWAAKELQDLPIKGVLYNMLKKKAPTEPQFRTGRGVLQQDKKLATTPAAYLDAIRRTHPTFEDRHILEYYGEYLQWMVGEPNQFFKRVAVVRTDFEIEALATDIYDIAREMVSKYTRIYPSPSWMNCGFCSFREPCLSLNKGMFDQAELLLRENYRHKVVAESLRETESIDTVGGNADA